MIYEIILAQLVLATVFGASEQPGDGVVNHASGHIRITIYTEDDYVQCLDEAVNELLSTPWSNKFFTEEFKDFARFYPNETVVDYVKEILQSMRLKRSKDVRLYDTPHHKCLMLKYITKTCREYNGTGWPAFQRLVEDKHKETLKWSCTSCSTI